MFTTCCPRIIARLTASEIEPRKPWKCLKAENTNRDALLQLKILVRMETTCGYTLKLSRCLKMPLSLLAMRMRTTMMAWVMQKD
jgi:hypothetical protein